MSETVEEVVEDAAKVRLFGSLSAKVLHALAPMICETQDYSHSMEFFCSQTSDKYCATYLVPAKTGAILVAVDPHRMLAVHDPEGYASCVMRVYFPDTLLNAVEPKTVTLQNENGCGFTVECEPKPKLLTLTDGFGLLYPENIEKWEGSLGTWFNGDHGNVRASASYRNEPAHVPFMSQLVNANFGDTTSDVDVDLSKLAPMCHAAKTLGLAVRLTLYAGKAIRLLSTDGGTFFGVLAPLETVKDFDPNNHLVTNTLLDPPAQTPRQSTNDSTTESD